VWKVLRTLKEQNTVEEVSLEDVGKEVVLTGWVDTRRDLGGIIFCRFERQNRNCSGCV